MELRSCLTYAAEIGIRQAAKYNGDQELLKKKKKKGNYDFGDGPDFTAMEVQEKSLKPYPQINKLGKLLRKRSLID